MQSPDRAPAVQGRCAQAAALSDALASLGRTPARMASLAAYGNGAVAGLPGRRGRAGSGNRSSTPGNFGVRLRKGLEGKERTAARAGLGGGCSARLEAAWNLERGCLQKESVELKRLKFRRYLGASGLQKNPFRFRTPRGRDTGVESFLTVPGSEICVQSALILSVTDLGQVI